jgi:hypothetical protein
MIKIVIDWDRLLDIKIKLIKSIISKRAYKGYCSWIEMEAKEEIETPLSFDEFKNFDFWKINIAFRQYFYYHKKVKYSTAKINFKSIIFNIQ